MTHPAVKEFFQKLTSAGGKARAAQMTKKERQESARNAARARWAKVKKEKA
jgi:hypothetical protein